jgi:hypothetical protein
MSRRSIAVSPPEEASSEPSVDTGASPDSTVASPFVLDYSGDGCGGWDGGFASIEEALAFASARYATRAVVTRDGARVGVFERRDCRYRWQKVAPKKGVINLLESRCHVVAEIDQSTSGIFFGVRTLCGQYVPAA